MSTSVNHRFVDALRVVLGLQPLYKQTKTKSAFSRAHSDMMLASGDGNRRVSSGTPEGGGRVSFKSETLEFKQRSRGKELRPGRRLDGRRVGASFTRSA